MSDPDRTPDPNLTNAAQENLIKALTSGEPSEVHPLVCDFVEVSPEYPVKISGRHASGSGGREDA